ncbi:MAG: 2Fe-2S iron-sulfur cluster-binding protein [Planctomycetota bacterium]|nr:2Fe-2S iron-sulfur cluster-binding protein [Planctomycetota bacterium]
MPKITIDNKTIECREGVPVLQAALEAGWDVPHYCYHPALSVVASCRLCLMEMKAPHPKTGELGWMPKLVPSCQTPVRDGMEVRFNSEIVQESQQSCMEYFLLNHPLDCPVCDQAGECYLQDYSFKFGSSESRMVEEKLKNPKKDIGPRTLLYQDRCVMCTRCVRFTEEVSGTGELTIVNRGSRAEIDVFPGLPLDNKLQGNVVDICPVGCLLDKDFLFQQRVWHLKGADSICPGCSTGCAIRIDQNDDVLYRLKPRFNPEVNDYWMCDEGRFGWEYVRDPARITAPILRRGSDEETPPWEDVPEIVSYRFEQFVEQQGSEKVAVVLSPMMACEEAWMLMRFFGMYAPQATVVLGPVPVDGSEEHFPVGCNPDDARFTIRSEKCPNRRGVELIIKESGHVTVTIEDFVTGCTEKKFVAAWICGGYPNKTWVSKELGTAAAGLELLVVQDMFAGALTEAAELVLPFCSWAEREGSFMNHAGLIQPFERAVNPPDGARRDGQYLYEIAGFTGLFDPARIREMMAEKMAEFNQVQEPQRKPVHQH